MNFLGYRGTSNHRPAFEHNGFKTGFSQVSGSRQPVVAAAYDDCIILFTHFASHYLFSI
jgi:hypothetical protein